MAYRLTDVDPEPGSVRYLTCVPFLPDGSCVALVSGSDLLLPAGEVLAGEDYVLDTSARVPLEIAGFRRQRVHAFADDDLPGCPGGHVYAWLDGDRYAGPRPHASAEWLQGKPELLARRLEQARRPIEARAVRDGAESLRTQADADYYAGNLRLLEPTYLRASTLEGGSGFEGTPDQWRNRRSMIVEGIDRDGTLLDLGCANGLLMESLVRWAAERGRRIEPYGVDLAHRLVEWARRRLPQWADRIEVGNAIDYRPTDGRTFTYVHALLDTVPRARYGDLVRHALRTLVAPGGRVLVSYYRGSVEADTTAPELLRDLGFAVVGSASATDQSAPVIATTAWIDAPGRSAPG